jgi:hypothetical protein
LELLTDDVEWSSLLLLIVSIAGVESVDVRISPKKWSKLQQAVRIV